MSHLPLFLHCDHATYGSFIMLSIVYDPINHFLASVNFSLKPPQSHFVILCDAVVASLQHNLHTKCGKLNILELCELYANFFKFYDSKIRTNLIFMKYIIKLPSYPFLEATVLLIILKSNTNRIGWKRRDLAEWPVMDIYKYQ